MPSTIDPASTLDFSVRREDLRDCRFAPLASEAVTPGPGQALLRIDCFAFTANNITYAAAGEMLSYWKFFPASQGWGRVPVWGFGEVVASQCDGVAHGDRLYGYFPMSTHLLVTPGRVTPGGFVDAVAHRQPLPSIYNQYLQTESDPFYAAEEEAQQMLLRPLFTTSFLLDDYFADNDFFGARSLILSSASSKTAIGLAFLLARNRGDRCSVIGLTSSANRAFVEGLGCYDQVISYHEVPSLPGDQPTALVDMAGNGQVVSALHHHFGEQMKHSCTVGATHWEHGKREGALPGAEPAFFFAPSQAQKRAQDWGPKALQARLAAQWSPFLASMKNWIQVQRSSGQDAVERVYRDTLEGQAQPKLGHILSL